MGCVCTQGGMGRNPSVQVYAPQDQLDHVEQYAEEHTGGNVSEAWRELARRGLQREALNHD